jgi:hypothetical protein
MLGTLDVLVELVESDCCKHAVPGYREKRSSSSIVKDLVEKEESQKGQKDRVHLVDFNDSVADLATVSCASFATAVSEPAPEL